jgi:hypothetical protein
MAEDNDWIHLTQDRDQWQENVNAVLKLQDAKRAGDFIIW